MTDFCYDTEFLEDGRTIELISIGIVREDGEEYYAVNSDMPIDDVRDHEWLARNVLPHLPIDNTRAMREYLEHPRNVYPQPSIDYVDLDRTSTLVKPKWVIANEVREFLAPMAELVIGERNGNPVVEEGTLPVLWANYSAYDHVALAQLWGPMVNLPWGIPMFTNDLQQLLAGLNGFEKPAQSGDEHHALADARWNMDVLRAARAYGAAKS